MLGKSTISPGDVNDNIANTNAQGISPKISPIDSGSVIGGEFGYMINRMFDMQINYLQEKYDSKDTIISPPGDTSADFKISQNVLAVTFDAYLVNMHWLFFHLGAGPAFPSSQKLE